MLNIMNSSEKIERILTEFLNSKNKRELELNASVRTVGDKIPTVLGHKIEKIFSKYIIQYTILENSKKICNIIIKDKYLNNYYIDIITHNVKKEFARPNITTVKNIEKLYTNDKNIFLILLIHYNPALENNFITNLQLFPIEWLDWKCLDIGALGNGQIQIKNSAHIILNKEVDRNVWKKNFNENLIVFYKKQQNKLRKRISQLGEYSLF